MSLQNEYLERLDEIERGFNAELKAVRKMWFWIGFTVGAALALGGTYLIGEYIVNSS